MYLFEYLFYIYKILYVDKKFQTYFRNITAIYVTCKLIAKIYSLAH